jgi:hypothetical protein
MFGLKTPIVFGLMKARIPLGYRRETPGDLDTIQSNGINKLYEYYDIYKGGDRAMKPVRLLRELKKAFPNDETKRIKLLHVTQDSEIEHNLIREWKYSKYYRTDLTTLANEIYESAQGLADETGEKERFEIVGVKSRNEDGERFIIMQEPRAMNPCIDPSNEGLIAQLMGFVERAYAKLDEVLAKQAEVQKDLINSVHKKLNELEKREEMLSEILRQYREVYAEREDRIRRDDRIDRLIEVTAGYFAPAAAEKMLQSGLITAETAARISAAGKDISEEVGEESEAVPVVKKESAN